MRRRGLFLLAFLSACGTSTAVKPPAPAPQPAPVQPSAPVPAPVPAPPVAQPYAPPVAPPGLGGSFASWKAAFADKAAARGFDRAFVEQALAGVEPDPRILDRDIRQPEFSKPVGDYVRSAISPARVEEGRRLRDARPWLAKIETQYGVPSEILIAIWAEESGFGKVQGDYDVISAFANLAYQGRRREWAEGELLDALVILRDKGVPRSLLKGSWAGAMGQTQFIPSAYLRLGQDFDGDGKVDIWTSDADALASAANHLAQEGWRTGQSWAVEITTPPGFDYSVAESEKHPPAWWADKGVRRADGRAWSAADQGSEAVLLAPSGAQGPLFLAFPNHFVIRKYNNSIAYALTIGLMADRVAGAPPLMRPWPHETPLSREDRMAVQAALIRLGYRLSQPDGLIGAETRAALRAWQKQNGLVADGYLTPELVHRLTAAGG
jgi:lytic murein transglycosylase